MHMRAAQAPRHRSRRAFAPIHSAFTPRVALRLAALRLAALRLEAFSLVQPHIIMAMSKVSSREAKTALNAAASMASVFRDAGELAKERELQFVIEKLSENDTLLFRLGGFLKDDSLIALLDGRMNATVQQDDGGSGSGKGSTPTSAVVRLEEVGSSRWGPLHF